MAYYTNFGSLEKLSVGYFLRRMMSIDRGKWAEEEMSFKQDYDDCITLSSNFWHNTLQG